MIEVQTLQEIPVPDPTKVPYNVFRKIIELVSERLRCNPIEGMILEKELDRIIFELYNLSDEEISVLSI